MTGPLETKVALPAVVVTIFDALAGALYGFFLAYEFIDPTPRQDLAIVGVGTALSYALWVTIAYLAPHTSRPDLGPVEGPQHAKPLN